MSLNFSMELPEFIQNEMIEFGSRHQRWPIRFRISYNRMVAHFYEPIPIRWETMVTNKILKPFDFSHGIPLNYVSRDHWSNRLSMLLTDEKLKELGHPNFQQNFCDIKGTVRNQVSIWNCDIKIDELTCVKLLRVQNRSLLSEYNAEFHLLLKS